MKIAFLAPLFLLAGFAARAQQPPAPQPPPDAAPSQAAPSPAAQPVVTAPAAAPASAVPLPCESAEEVTARVHFERALRAELEARSHEAKSEAQAGLDASPSGRFAPALRALQQRLAAAGAARPPGATRAGSRAEMIVNATLEGAALGVLASAGVQADAKGTAGLTMLGTGAGLVLSVVLTDGRTLRTAAPPLLGTGALYGGLATAALAELADVKGNYAIAAGAGVLAGSLLGLTAANELKLTAGDAGALSVGMLYGAALPVALEGALVADPGKKPAIATALIGGTLGLVLLPIANHQLDWSRSRWTLVGLGGGVGALFGAGTAVLVGAKDSQPILGLLAGGAIAGLGLSAAFTSNFDAGEVPESRALLDLAPDGKVRMGSLLTAIHPELRPGRSGHVEAGVGLSLLAGQF